jgi:hypothetical protein
MTVNPKIIKYTLITALVLLECTSCVSSRMTHSWSKKQEVFCSSVNHGKNIYYHTGNYQRKLKKSELKIGGKFITKFR